MSISTAVIPVAGAGSRMFPAVTSIEKCMQPVYSGSEAIPLVDYMVRDCAAAGVQRIIFVTTERGRVQLTGYFGTTLNSTLDTQLRRVGKTSTIEAELERRKNYGVSFEYLIQDPTLYGTTVPLHTAQQALQGESEFALIGGDDFVYHPDGTSELGLAIASWKASMADYAVMGLPIKRSLSGSYGILQTNANGTLSAIDEKPPKERWPLRPVANISRYLMSDKIWPIVAAEMARDRGQGEHLITYIINDALQVGQSFFVHPVTGTYLDGGNPQGMLRASQYITEHPRTS